MQQTLYLLDGMALAYRSHFAFMRSPITTSKGFNTSAIYGFTATLVELIAKQKPSHLALVFDTSAPTERHRIHPEYKANREAMPEELAEALPPLDRVAHAFGIPTIRLDGYEADDIIGTLAHRAEADGFQEIFMVTPDKDFGQLVTDRIKMYRPSRGGDDAEVLDPAAICKKWDITRVDQVIDMLGLCGDTADNIPGVPGIGPKTAAKLLAQYDTVENLLEHTDELKGKQQERLRDNADQARLSKTLATIQLDVPCSCDWDDLQLDSPDPEKITPLLVEFEFRTLGKRIFGSHYVHQQAPEDLVLQAEDATADSGEAQLDLPAPVPFKQLADFKVNYRSLEHPEDIRTLVEELRAAGSFAFDTETTSLNPLRAKLVGCSFSAQAQSGYFVPASEEALKILRPLFADPNLELVGHNLKFDLAVLLVHDCPVTGTCHDTLLAHSLLEPTQRHGLDTLAENHLNYSPIPFNEILPEAKKGEDVDFSQVDPKRLAEYAIEDADIALQLWQKFQPKLKSSGQEKVFREIETPLLPVLAQVELEGINLDTENLLAIGTEFQGHIETLEGRIFSAAGREFNLNSPRQIGEVLFDELKLIEKPKKTKTGQYATSEQVLTALAPEHPIIADLLEYRQLTKLKSTYIDALPQAIETKTGRVHTHYGQLQTATGRLTSNNPNLQNIPVRSERERAIRKAFVPRASGWQILAADYSQIELRVLAALTHDAGLLQAFREGQNIHSATAAKIFQVKPEDVTREQRSTAKMVNFGIPYGISAYGLAQRLGNSSRTEAQEIIDNYFQQFPGTLKFMESQKEFACKNGYVETLFGRRRALPDIDSRNATIRNAAQRNAINMPIQGTAADMIKLAMIRVQNAIAQAELQSRLLLQVHDELVFDLAPGEEAPLREIITEGMTQALPLDCPVEIDIGIGQNWLEAH
ncbi:MAG: DNA polymerase I [Verrucomicrobia bacterium]|nr:DNA polymerase I [Verrucomicrobiota bacterium]